MPSNYGKIMNIALSNVLKEQKCQQNTNVHWFNAMEVVRQERLSTKSKKKQQMQHLCSNATSYNLQGMLLYVLIDGKLAVV